MPFSGIEFGAATETRFSSDERHHWDLLQEGSAAAHNRSYAIDARDARRVASPGDKSIDKHVEVIHAYKCPNYPKSKRRAAA
jgi:hypothetical protein